MSWEEIDRLRHLVPERADWHLANWGLWRRSEQLTDGYDDESVGFAPNGGCAAEESSDHLFERQLGGYAEICDAVIEGLDLRHRLVISQVYEASVFRFRESIDDELVAAAAEFWCRAQRKGLL